MNFGIVTDLVQYKYRCICLLGGLNYLICFFKISTVARFKISHLGRRDELFISDFIPLGKHLR